MRNRNNNHISQAEQGQESTLRRLLRYIRPYRAFLILSLLCAALSVLCTLYAPIMTGRAIDLMIGAGKVDRAGLPSVLIRFAIAAVGAAVFQWLLSYFNNVISYRAVTDLRNAAFDKLTRVPLSYIDRHSHGDLLNRLISDIDLVSDGMIQTFTQFFSGVLTILLTLGIMFYYNPIIAAAVVLLTPLSVFVAVWLARRCHRFFGAQTKTQGEIGGTVEEMMSEQRLIRAFGYEAGAEATFEEVNLRLYECGRRAHFYSALVNPSTRFVNNLVYAAVVVIGTLGALDILPIGITVGGISVFLTYANQYTKPFNEISGIVTQLQTALASARRVFELLEEPEDIDPETTPAARALNPAAVRGEIEIRDVCFSYTPERPLIEHFNLSVHAGERIAIVGPTGCGKTTMINLLMRFYDVCSGSIRIDGVPTDEMPRADLRSLFGMVLQDTWLFEGTVRENIAYGRPDATEPEIVAAARAAYADSFIRRLPQGYDTRIAADGDNLSAGQCQLLCIARVMLTDPPMLILDEATSHIDTRTELHVQRAFEKMMEGRTSFIVAHRLATIRHCDTILVMRDGHVIEQGNHEQLLAADGFYASLCKKL